jgi:hypothetical protein
MKSKSLAVLLISFLAFAVMGCADRSQPIVAPADQPAQRLASLEKSTNVPFDFTNQPFWVTSEPDWWIAGGVLQMKKVHVLERIEASDSRLTGQMEHYLSLSVGVVTGEGPCHGSFTATPDDQSVGGVWEGTYEGYRSRTDNPLVFTLPLKVVGHGRGGTINGMQVFMTTTLAVVTDAAHYPIPTGWIGSNGSGYIKEH